MKVGFFIGNNEGICSFLALIRSRIGSLTLSDQVKQTPLPNQHLQHLHLYHHHLHLHKPTLPSIPISTMADTELKSLHTVLLSSVSKADYTAASQTLSALKLALLERNALIPSASTPVSTLLLAREILEVGALTSIHQTDDAAFSRYYSQLQPFYEDGRLTAKSPSPHRSKIVGLHLLLLLSKNDIADFHTTLENLEAPEEDPFIKHPIMLERWLMEGSYDKVWNATKSTQVPSEEFALFSQVSLIPSG